MHHLTTLTLPSFDAAIFPDRRAGFRLKRLTLLCTTMSQNERAQLFEWLVAQPDILSLSFPDLIEHVDSVNGLAAPTVTGGSRSGTPAYDFLDLAPISCSLLSSTTTD
jgi:hypothetical protein